MQRWGNTPQTRIQILNDKERVGDIGLVGSLNLETAMSSKGSNVLLVYPKEESSNLGHPSENIQIKTRKMCPLQSRL